MSPIYSSSLYFLLFFLTLLTFLYVKGLIQRTYSLVGIRDDVDFMLWRIAFDVRDFQEAQARLNRTRLMGYLTAVLARERVEQFRVLFLDARNRLIADEAQARGTVNHTPVYPREVVKRALELQATALILVHNHPSGDPTPSRADIDMTQEVKAAATVMGIALHDHLIIGNGRHVSFRREGLI